MIIGALSGQIRDEISGQIAGVLLILIVLFLLSHYFNKWIEHSGNKIEGLDWLLVVIGVTYTQAAVGLLDILLDWNAFFIGMLAYAASGFEMIRGAMRRDRDAVARARKALNE